MSRRYFDRIRVVVGPADADPPMPTAFMWRRRRFRVTAVLARWIEAEQWWKAPPGADGDRAGDRIVWRLEASAGPSTGVYDLCQHTRPSGGWFLVRSFD